MSRGSDLWVRLSETETPFADLIDVTLADEDTNPILNIKKLIVPVLGGRGSPYHSICR